MSCVQTSLLKRNSKECSHSAVQVGKRNIYFLNFASGSKMSGWLNGESINPF